MPIQHGRVGHRWREAQKPVFEQESHCWLCGEYVDQRLSAQGPLARLSRSVDHLVQLQHHGDPYRREGLRLAHLGCNAARSNRLRNIPIEQCACSHGMPCALLNPAQPRGWVELDPSEV